MPVQRRCASISAWNSDRHNVNFCFPTERRIIMTLFRLLSLASIGFLSGGCANSGQVTLGIYEILDPNHKRACWGPPGGPRPTEFQSPPGSHRILQYWEKIGPVLNR